MEGGRMNNYRVLLTNGETVVVPATEVTFRDGDAVFWKSAFSIRVAYSKGTWASISNEGTGE